MPSPTRDRSQLFSLNHTLTSAPLLDDGPKEKEHLLRLVFRRETPLFPPPPRPVLQLSLTKIQVFQLPYPFQLHPVERQRNCTLREIHYLFKVRVSYFIGVAICPRRLGCKQPVYQNLGIRLQGCALPYLFRQLAVPQAIPAVRKAGCGARLRSQCCHLPYKRQGRRGILSRRATTSAQHTVHLVLRQHDECTDLPALQSAMTVCGHYYNAEGLEG